MEITNIFITIGISVVTGAAGGGFFVWFGKEWISNWFAKDLENHTAELSRTTNELQEKLRIEYGSLYEKRVVAIVEMYRQIFELQHLLDFYPQVRYMEVESDECHRWVTDFTANLIKVSKTLSALIAKNLIYFSKEDAEKLIIIRIQLCAFIQANVIFGNGINEENHGDPDTLTSCFLVDNRDILFSLNTPEVLDHILTRFRELIGVNK